MDVNYTTTGSAKTATVELISSATLNNDEISLELEYLGTASSSLASFANSLPVTVLTAASAVTTSTATWNSSPATPQKQKLQVTFTPRTAGRVRARVRLGKASTTVYVDPQVTIT
jgi:pectin methylesterase-like acyl-CoA thioesterase